VVQRAFLRQKSASEGMIYEVELRRAQCELDDTSVGRPHAWLFYRFMDYLGLRGRYLDAERDAFWASRVVPRSKPPSFVPVEYHILYYPFVSATSSATSGSEVADTPEEALICECFVSARQLVCQG
jgi:hypothetical protein